MDLLTDHQPDDPGLDMALTHAILQAVATGTSRDTIRVYRPGASVAFGRLDSRSPGFASAAQAAREHGRTPIVRLAGGRAAAYDDDCLIVEIIQRIEQSIGDLDDRFQEMASLLHDATAAAGVPLELGELAGEYCPGRYSLHLPAGPKVAGIAQRVIRGAALTTAVLVVQGGDELRATISSVYEALDLPVRAGAAGALSDSHFEITVEGIENSILASIGDRLQVERMTIAPSLRRTAVLASAASEVRIAL